jgi:maleylacetoacetate isomerase
MKLYTYFRSSASFRVRIALNLKGLAVDQSFIHLRKNEQTQPAYLELCPAGLVPTLEEDGQLLTQSMAIIEYLEETHPEPPLLPGHPADRARVRAIAQTIACEVHPLDNLRVLRYLIHTLKQDEAAVEAWYNHWIALSFAALEKTLAEDGLAGEFCHGDEPGLADICLVPQCFNARRYPSFDFTPYPTLTRIFENCMTLDAFDKARPDKQPDAE